jgi:hypothetical protein
LKSFTGCLAHRLVVQDAAFGQVGGRESRPSLGRLAGRKALASELGGDGLAGVVDLDTEADERQQDAICDELFEPPVAAVSCSTHKMGHPTGTRGGAGGR